MFTEHTFNIPELKGMSKGSIEEHIKLYQGYVKHANLILEKTKAMSADLATNAHSLTELYRRFSFEFDGLRNHEYYFHSLEGGASALNTEGALATKITETWGSVDTWLSLFKAIALTRGPGWAILYFDPHTKQLLNAWIDEQHLGQLTGLQPIVALDMWEHSFVADYKPSGKKAYVEDFFANLNWKYCENLFDAAARLGA